MGKHTDSTNPKTQEQLDAEAKLALEAKQELERKAAELAEDEGDKTVQVMQVNDTLAFIKQRGSVRVKDMQQKYEHANVFDLPHARNGQPINKVNEDLHYMWLLVADLKSPDWRNYAPVIKGNDGAVNLPAKAFLPDGTIMVGAHYLCYTTKEYHLSKRLDPRGLMQSAIQSFVGTQSEQEGTGLKHAAAISTSETEVSSEPARTTPAEERAA
jgi:hypothetical protein